MKINTNKILQSFFDFNHALSNRRRGLGSLVNWLIRIVIYDICITSIAEIFGVSRLIALFIFLGLLAAFSFGAYVLKQKISSPVDD